MTHGSWPGRHILPYYQAGDSDSPASPCGNTAEQVMLLGYGRGTGGGGVLEASWRHPCPPPQHKKKLKERLLARLRRQQQLWILRRVLFGCRDYFDRKNIFIDKTLSVLWSCFARSFVWFASPWQELCLPPDLWKIHDSMSDSLSLFLKKASNYCSYKWESEIPQVFSFCNDDFWHNLIVVYYYPLFLHFYIQSVHEGQSWRIAYVFFGCK